MKETTHYSEQFFHMVKSTAIGIGIGYLISLLFMYAICYKNDINIKELLTTSLMIDILVGPCIAIILSTKQNTQTHASNWAMKFFTGFKDTCINIESSSGAGSMFSILKFVIGLVVLIPIIIYMVISYFLNFAYFAIMCLLEKKHFLDNKQKLCQFTDIIMQIIIFVLMTIVIMVIIKRYSF